MSDVIIVRPAGPADLAVLPDVERRAAALFTGREMAASVLADATSPADFRQAEARGLLWVAAGRDGTPVGFALAEPLDGNLHLDELDVLPEYGRRGIGTALVRAVCAHADRVGVAAVTLTTFRDVPWNAPFYAALGFQPLPASACTPHLARTVAKETAAGLDPSRRLVMHRPTVSTGTPAREARNKQLVARWVEALDAGDTDRVCALYAEDLRYFVVGNWPLGGHFDRAYMERNCRDVFTVFPEGLHFSAERLVAEGDWVCLEMRSRGAHVSGRSYGNHYTYWFEIRDGKIVQLKEWLDTLHANEVLCGTGAAIDFADRRR